MQVLTCSLATHHYETIKWTLQNRLEILSVNGVGYTYMASLSTAALFRIIAWSEKGHTQTRAQHAAVPRNSQYSSDNCPQSLYYSRRRITLKPTGRMVG